MSDDLFAGVKKKKKSSKKTEAALETLASPAAPSSALKSADAAPDAAKKTVRIDEVSEVLGEATGEAPAPAALDKLGNEIPDDFADLKKKKKKSKKTNFDMDAFEKEIKQDEPGEESDEAPEAGDDLFEGDAENAAPARSRAEAAYEAQGWITENRDYTYTELLGRFYSLLYATHPSLSSSGTAKKKYTIPPPQMMREGNKRSIFNNLTEICKKMHRQPDHVIQFLFAELGTNGSVDGAGRLVIKGRFQQKQMENVLRRYIVEYVTCKTCKSADTTIAKRDRLFFMTCAQCGSERSVASIKTGFQHLKRK